MLRLTEQFNEAETAHESLDSGSCGYIDDGISRTEGSACGQQKFHIRAAALALCAAACLTLAACGSRSDSDSAANEAGIETEADLNDSKAAEASSEEDSADEAETSAAETYAALSGYEESMAADKGDIAEDESPYYGIMHANVIDINGNVGESNTVYSFKDKNDPENIWSVTGLEIGDIEADMAVGNDVVVLYNGDIVNDAENLQFMVLLPDGAYTLKVAEGITTSNTMSVFTVRTDSGSTIDFLKDNCRIDEAALKSDSGDRVKVYFADGGELGNYPLRVVAG